MSNEVEKNYKITATPDFADQNPNGKTFVQSKTVIVFSVALISWLLTYFKLLPQDAIDALANARAIIAKATTPNELR